MRKLSNTFFLVSTIIAGILSLGIALAWMLPMYLIGYKKAKVDHEPHIALGVCSILFGWIFGIVAGILLLCDPKGNKSV